MPPCTPWAAAPRGSARSLAAEKVYVAPGELDKYYAFLSGGQSGSVFVVGVPSGRLIREIPVFEPRAAYGYAMNDNDPRRQELVATGGVWGDTHHPVLSETDGMPTASISGSTTSPTAGSRASVSTTSRPTAS